MVLKQWIGNTPLIPIPCSGITLLAKAEWRNPAGSVKDRAAAAMMAAALEQGQLKPGGCLVEATSGNTGIALAALAAEAGCRCCIAMPENASRERVALLRAYGAEVLLTPAGEGMAGAVRVARRLAETDPQCFYVNQFANPANPAAHYRATGPEIWAQTGGRVDVFVAGIGTGGTVTGVGTYLKEQKPEVEIVGVEPGPGEGIPGLGAGFVPPVLREDILDQRIPVTGAEAAAQVGLLARCTGLLVGPSGGAALHAARCLSREAKYRNKTVVVLLPDSGERYLSDLPDGPL